MVIGTLTFGSVYNDSVILVIPADQSFYIPPHHLSIELLGVSAGARIVVGDEDGRDVVGLTVLDGG